MHWNRNRRVVITLLVATLMLVAGCTGPADDANGTVGDGDGAAVGPTDTTEADAGGDEPALGGTETTVDAAIHPIVP